MRTKFLSLLAAVLLSGTASAAVITSFGAGSAVTGTPSYQADFTNVPSGVINHIEGGIVTTSTASNNQCCFSNAIYGGGGDVGYFNISTVGGVDFGAIEVGIGSGFEISTHNVVWETLRDGISTGSGLLQVANIGYPGNFALLGWSDVSLFDTLRLGAAPSSTGYSAFGSFQAIALDSVRIGSASSAEVPEPSVLALFSLGLLGLAARRRKA